MTRVPRVAGLALAALHLACVAVGATWIIVAFAPGKGESPMVWIYFAFLDLSRWLPFGSSRCDIVARYFVSSARSKQLGGVLGAIDLLFRRRHDVVVLHWFGPRAHLHSDFQIPWQPLTAHLINRQS